MPHDSILNDRTLVFLDLETTGLAPGQDRIIEIGGLKSRGAEEVEVFEALVKPGVPIPSFVTRLTGITEEEVARNGRELEPTLKDLRRFVGEAPIIGHNLGFDLSFLKTAGLDLPNKTLDTAILTALVLPTEKHYSLRVLARKFFGETEQHRSLADSRHTFRLFRAVVEKLEPSDRPLLEKLAGLLSGPEPLLSELFRELAADAERWKRLEKKGGTAEKRPPHPPSPARGEDSDKGGSSAKGEGSPIAVAPEDAARLLDKDGLLSRMAGYEHRPQQPEMAGLVCSALARKEKLVVEAPTGVGKTLAYLVPAILFAAADGKRVVVSTNTRTLQAQIWEKELPFLRENLTGIQWRASRLLGRENYFCLRRSSDIYKENQGLFPKNEIALAYLLSFQHKSREGILEDVAGFMQQRFPDLRVWLEEMRASAKTCLNRACLFHRDCFYQRARAAAESSDLIISNHALTLSPPAWFPEFHRLILDEAHNIEDAASESYSRGVESDQVAGVLSSLAGFLADENKRDRVSGEIKGKIPAVRRFWHQFSGGMLRLLPEFGTVNVEALKKDNRWPEIEVDRQNFLLAWKELEALFGKAGEGRITGLAEESAQRRLAVSSLQKELQELREDMEFVYNPQENYVAYGRRRGAEKAWSAKAVPIEVDSFLRERLFGGLETLICTSATLTVTGRFDFFLNRWGLAGLQGVVTAKLDSPFDYSSQSILAIPRNFQRYDYNDHPGIFVSALAGGIRETALALRGKELALFSARSRMEEVYSRIKEDLEGRGVAVMCQNIDGFRSFLVETLKNAPGDMLLLGSKSFQEGVDISGLKAVLIEKMPFASRSDPLVEARQKAVSRKGGKPFQDYILPLAVIGLRQSFGRLIRNRSDRGAVVIFDPRLLTDYPEVLDSLPDCPKVIENIPAFYRKLAEACSDQAQGHTGTK